VQKDINNPFDLPIPDESDYSIFYLPKSCKRILLLSDIHIPFHDVKSLTKAIQLGIDNKVDTVLLNGDIADNYQVSRFEKDPRKRSFKSEIEMVKDFLKRIRLTFNKAKIYYKQGNHEERWESFLKRKAPELLDMTEFKFDVILGLNELDISYISDKRIIKVGNLNILHGHELGSSSFSPVNPARSFFLRAKTNIIAGHHHQTSEHIEHDINGNHIKAYSTGCLCSLVAEYMPLNKWNHGISLITIKNDKALVQNIRL